MTGKNGFRVLRRDFTDGRCACALCYRPLASGIAHVLLHPQKAELAVGENCARHAGRPTDFPVPDLTRGVAAGYFDLPPGRQVLPLDIPPVQRAVEYALMRQALSHRPMAYPVQRLLAAYAQDAVLTPDLVQPVLKGMAAANRADPRESERAVTHAYAALRMLDRCLGNTSLPSKVFLASVRDQVLERHWLSPRQVDIINQKLAIVSPGAPRLDRAGFKAEPFPPAMRRRRVDPSLQTGLF